MEFWLHCRHFGAVPASGIEGLRDEETTEGKEVKNRKNKINTRPIHVRVIVLHKHHHRYCYNWIIYICIYSYIELAVHILYIYIIIIICIGAVLLTTRPEGAIRTCYRGSFNALLRGPRSWKEGSRTTKTARGSRQEEARGRAQEKTQASAVAGARRAGRGVESALLN